MFGWMDSKSFYSSTGMNLSREFHPRIYQRLSSIGYGKTLGHHYQNATWKRMSGSNCARLVRDSFAHFECYGNNMTQITDEE